MSTTPSTFRLQFTRTVVPYLVATIVSFAADKFGIHLDTGQVAVAVTFGLGSAYYGVVTLLERRWPSLGWLLGHPGRPAYTAATGSAISGISSELIQTLQNTLTSATQPTTLTVHPAIPAVPATVTVNPVSTDPVAPVAPAAPATP